MAAIKSLLLLRLLQGVFVAWCVGTLTFIFSRNLSDDMALRIAAGRYGDDIADNEAADFVRAQLGLDDSVFVQYTRWMLDLIQLNLGESLVSGDAVIGILSHELGLSVALAIAALSVSILIGPILGVFVGVSSRRWPWLLSSGSAIVVRSIPSFGIGIILMLIFSVKLQWLPVAGHGSWQHFLLPMFTLALGLTVLSIRMSAHATREVLHTDFYQFGRLKGLSSSQNFWRHGVRNIASPLIAYHGIQLIYLVEGVVVVESLFAWPGIGHALAHAIFDRDIPVLQGAAMTIAVGFVLLNTVIDLVNHWLDPRQHVR